jgi:hypothetical protein
LHGIKGFVGPNKEMRKISRAGKLWVEQGNRLRNNQKAGMFPSVAGARNDLAKTIARKQVRSALPGRLLAQ